MGFAVHALHVSPKEFWTLTPKEYFKAVKGWMAINHANDDNVKSQQWTPEMEAMAQQVMEDENFGRT